MPRKSKVTLDVAKEIENANLKAPEIVADKDKEEIIEVPKSVEQNMMMKTPKKGRGRPSGSTKKKPVEGEIEDKKEAVKVEKKAPAKQEDRVIEILNMEKKIVDKISIHVQFKQ